MKHFQRCKYMLAFLLALLVVKATAVAENAFEECSKELMTYFPEALMNETFQKFNVTQDKWANINKELNERDNNIIKEVEAKAAKMKPNPLKDPQHRQAALTLFKDTLYDVFSETLHKNGITDDKQIQAMLDELQRQKAKKFAACLEKYKSQIHAPNSPPELPQERPTENAQKSQMALEDENFNEMLKSSALQDDSVKRLEGVKKGYANEGFGEGYMLKDSQEW